MQPLGLFLRLHTGTMGSAPSLLRPFPPLLDHATTTITNTATTTANATTTNPDR